MRKKHTHKLLTLLIAMVWLVNGLFCKVFNLVPRHKEIVSVIAGNDSASIIITAIGLAETILAIWIIFNKWPKATALFQIVIILTMNITEQLLTPELLLWGRLNLLFAAAFCVVIYHQGFYYRDNQNLTNA